MIGLIAIFVLLVLLTVATWAFARVFGIAQRRGKSNLVSAVWGGVAVLVLSLPITWDAIPTWIAFEYYKKDAGLTVFKTLEQWKLENPGVAETLVPYAVGDKRGESRNLGNSKFRHPLSDRFAYDNSKKNLFLSVYSVRYEVVDRKNDEVLVGHTAVGSGNAGGLATGGAGWWAFWLIHETPDAVASGFFNFVESLNTLGVKK